MSPEVKYFVGGQEIGVPVSLLLNPSSFSKGARLTCRVRPVKGRGARKKARSFVYSFVACFAGVPDFVIGRHIICSSWNN